MPLTAHLITGYQYNPETGRYIGPYSFPNNLDQETLHLPPCTVLDAPGLAPAGQAWFRIEDAWVLQDAGIQASRPPIEDYALLRADAIELMRSQGSWTEEDQAALEAAQAVAQAVAQAAAEPEAPKATAEDADAVTEVTAQGDGHAD